MISRSRHMTIIDSGVLTAVYIIYHIVCELKSDVNICDG